ncbi:hypothetical protein BDC45DRAFT_565108 [Circinella umbellata]|nr:hypothetical protein BDC45DRAFT_565108 [Circinella umbellata]
MQPPAPPLLPIYNSNYNNYNNNQYNCSSQQHENINNSSQSPPTPLVHTPPPPLPLLTTTHNNNNNSLPFSLFDTPPRGNDIKMSTESTSSSTEPPMTDYPQEVTWLFFRDNQWVPFQNENHFKIEQAFTMGGIYVDIKDNNFPQLKSIRVFPARFYLSYLGMKYRLSCVIQG